jgi:hypothetical protein
MTPEERADAIARGAEWSRDEYLRDPDGNEYPNAVVDLDALARLIADAIRAAVEAVAASKPKWTEQAPTAPGWYWVRWAGAATDTEVVEVWEDLTTDLYGAASEMDGAEWCGPLEEPK